MKRQKYCGLLLTVALAGMALSCDQSFDPKGVYEDRLVVYSILSTDRNQQFVRVFSTYDPPGYDPREVGNDRQIRGALVSMQETGSLVQFRDTALARPDTSRYKDSLRLYVGAPFLPQSGKTYRLSVSTPTYGMVTATVTMPSSGTLSVTAGYSAVTVPNSTDPNRLISLHATFSSATRGYLIRMQVDYEVQTDTGWKLERVEIPYLFQGGGFDLTKAVYPTLTRALTHATRVDFVNGGYRAVLNHVILDRHPTRLITFKHIAFYLLQAEANMYDYYSITSGFQDPYSIRLDQPLHANIQGGYGVFGGYTLDSLIFPLPVNFEYNRR